MPQADPKTTPADLVFTAARTPISRRRVERCGVTISASCGPIVGKT
jgi:hypothetical protein